MIPFEYDPALMEEAVFQAARRDPRREAELHAAIDPLYTLEEGPQREEAFTAAFGRFFAEFQLAGIIEELLDEWPLISDHISRCIVRRAKRRKAESAELFVKQASPASAERTLILQVCSESLLQPEAFRHVMRRELLHVADMLDPAFAYVPDDLLGGTPRDNLIRDRYRVLWDIYVEGRVRTQNTQDAPPPEVQAALERLLARAFTCAQIEDARQIIHYVSSSAALTHQQLSDWAQDPASLLAAVREPITSARC